MLVIVRTSLLLVLSNIFMTLYQLVLKDESTGAVIDFYGPCNESPTGPDQVQSQRLEEAHRFFDSYAG